jgi:hypothetical protein
MHILIKFIDGTEQKEYAEEFPRVKDGLLIIPKGRYSPSMYINMQTIKSFQECER